MGSPPGDRGGIELLVGFAALTAASGRGDEVHRVLDVVWRMESPRLVAALTRIVRDVGLAEDLAQDALEAALRQWPDAGIPDDPAAWLMGTARHRAIDALRRRTTLQRKAEELGRDLEGPSRTRAPATLSVYFFGMLLFHVSR